MTSLKYRPDIDCLRAFSVLAVIGYHFDIPPFRRGFVGVDVFFVISGYLITRIICSEASAGAFSLSDFYFRRARRILPALYATVGATLAAAYFVIPPAGYVDLANQALAVIGFSSNFLFWSQHDYFNSISLSKPLLQTWSLAVEEQFYFLFPVAVILLFKRGQPLGRWLGTIGIASLLFCVYQSDAFPSAAFYLLPARAWEFCLGGMLACGAIPEISPLVSRLAALFGWMLLAVSVNAGGHQYPSFNAALPCGGAALVIWGNTLLLPDRTIRPLLAMGRISYSLYLWHWPVAVFSYLILDGNRAASVKIALLAVCFLLATASYLFIEVPFRRARGFSTVGIPIAAGALSAASIAVLASSGFENRLTPAEAEIAKFLSYDHHALYDVGRCFVQLDEQFQSRDCLKAMSGAKNILVWGDSYAAHLVSGLRSSDPSANYMQATMAGCVPLTHDRLSKRSCASFNEEILQQALELRPDVVLLSANWAAYAYPGGTFAGGLEELIVRLQSNGIAVDVAGPTPVFDIAVPTLLLTQFRFKNWLPNPSVRLLPGLFAVDKALGATTVRAGARYISLLASVCPKMECPLAVNNEPLSWDAGHLTAAGSLLAAGVILQAIHSENIQR